MKTKARKQARPQKVNRNLLGPCGFYCGYCLAFKYGKCSGCIAMSKRAEKIGEVFCDIYPCVTQKGLTVCADCDSYPCEKYDKNRAGIFSESFISWIRNEIRAKGPNE